MNMMTAVAAVPAITMPTAALAIRRDRSDWDRAMARFRAAERECQAIGRKDEEVQRAYFERAKAVPHVTLRPDPYTGRHNSVSTADERFALEARSLVRDVDAGKCHLDALPDLQEHLRLCREMVGAADRRQAELDAIDVELGRTASEKAYDAAVDRMGEARDALIAIPAPDGEALLWKLEWLFFSDHLWDEEFAAPAIADAKRILSIQ